MPFERRADRLIACFSNSHPTGIHCLLSCATVRREAMQPLTDEARPKTADGARIARSVKVGRNDACPRGSGGPDLRELASERKCA